MDSHHVLISLSNTRNAKTKYLVFFHLLFLLCTVIRPRTMVLIDLFLLFAHDQSTNIYGPLSFNFFCTRPFDQNIWSSFIYSFFCARPFEQKLGFSLIYFFYLNTTFRLKCMILFHTFFLYARSFDQKLGSSLIYLFYLCTAIRPKLGVILTL